MLEFYIMTLVENDMEDREAQLMFWCRPALQAECSTSCIQSKKMPHELIGSVPALLPTLRLEFAASSGAESSILALRARGKGVVIRRQGYVSVLQVKFSVTVSFELDAVR